MIKVALCGACGRMGRTIVSEIAKKHDMKLVAAIDAPRTPFIGKDAGGLAGLTKLGVVVVGAEKITDALKRAKPDVLVDFTNANAAVQNVETAASLHIPVVVGTTGFSREQLERIKKAVKKAKIPAVVAPNMSVGVNVLFKLAGDAARLLGKDYDVEIIETHHAHKADSPSGTALRIAEIIAEEFGWNKESIKCGRPAGKRPRAKGEIYIHSLRVGDVTGEHIVTFAAPGERVEVVHHAHSRETFAAGAIKAIRFVVEKGRPGIVQDMRDILSLT